MNYKYMFVVLFILFLQMNTYALNIQVTVNEGKPVPIDYPINVETTLRNRSKKSIKTLAPDCFEGMVFYIKEATDSIWTSIMRNKLMEHSKCDTRISGKSVFYATDELFWCMLKPAAKYHLRVVCFQKKGEHAYINVQEPSKSKDCKFIFDDFIFTTETLTEPDQSAYTWIVTHNLECNLIFNGDLPFDDQKIDQIKNFIKFYATTKFTPHAKIIIIKSMGILIRDKRNIKKHDLIVAKQYCNDLNDIRYGKNGLYLQSYLNNIERAIEEVKE